MRGIADDGVNLSPYVARGSHSANEAMVELRWHNELYGASQPRPGAVLEFRQDGSPLWIGIIEALSDYSEQRGTRALTLVARSRDGTPLWRDIKRVSDAYPLSTDLGVIAESVARNIGLDDDEFDLPALNINTPHTTTQLADLSAWEMLEAILLPAGLEPWVDAVGKLKAISRDTAREAAQILSAERIVRVGGSRSRTAPTSVKVLWLDTELTKVTQQDQALAQATITAGFFKLNQRQRVYWSDDRTQRAENTRLAVLQSVNDGLLRVGSERYSQTTPYGGEITVTTDAWVPGLATASIATLVGLAAAPDGVVTDPLSGVGFTIPHGRIAQMVAQGTLLVVMMSLGTGMYEIWGTPYDYVHARNETEAYDDAAPEWHDNPVEIECDLIVSEAHAQEMAIRELRYAAAQARTYHATIIDDPRIERGDILELHDGSRLYVTDYGRDITRGSAAVLHVEGFRV